MKKKYKLLKITSKNKSDTSLYRIQALRDFGDVKKGDLGGYVETEDNLSHSGNCWLYNEATVLDQSRVLNNACVYDNAKIFGDSLIYENAKIFNNCIVFGKPRIFGNSRIYDHVTSSPA